jgi:CrcB protein
MNFQNLVLVFLGSGIGGCVRFGMGWGIQQFWKNPFPMGTLLINILACSVAAWIINQTGLFQGMEPQFRTFLLVGFCGGFSTFSTFSLETVELIQKGLWVQALAYSLLSIVAGIMVFFLILKPGLK